MIIIIITIIIIIMIIIIITISVIDVIHSCKLRTTCISSFLHKFVFSLSEMQ